MLLSSSTRRIFSAMVFLFSHGVLHIISVRQAPDPVERDATQSSMMVSRLAECGWGNHFIGRAENRWASSQAPVRDMHLHGSRDRLAMQEVLQASEHGMTDLCPLGNQQSAIGSADVFLKNHLAFQF